MSGPAALAEKWREIAAVHLANCEDGTEAAIMTGLAAGFDHHVKRADAAEAESSKLLADLAEVTAERNALLKSLHSGPVTAHAVARLGLKLSTALAAYREGHEDVDACPEWPDDIEGDDERTAHICNVTFEPWVCLAWMADNAERLDLEAPGEPYPEPELDDLQF